MKRRIFCSLLFIIILSTSYSQACIDTVEKGLTLLNKFNLSGPDCLFSVKFCIRKTSADAHMIEYAVYTTKQDIFDSIDVSGISVGSMICRVFTFAADCNSSASFVAVGREKSNSICGVVADLILLPIKLLSFSADMQTAGLVDLTWETASESNSSHFVIQQSTDGKSFLDLAKIRAAGESTSLQTYTWQIANTASSPFLNYYRLKMVDKDESYTYSPIITFGKSGTRRFQVFPNPASNVLKINKNDLQKTELKMSNLQGQEHAIVWLNENTLDVGNLKPGLYFIKYFNEVIRFVKN